MPKARNPRSGANPEPSEMKGVIGKSNAFCGVRIGNVC